MSNKTPKQVEAIRRSLGCRASRPTVAPRMEAETEEEEEEEEDEGQDGEQPAKKKAKKSPPRPPLTATEKFEIHQLVNSMHRSVGVTRERAIAEQETLDWLYSNVPHTDPTCNRGIVLGDMVQMSRFMSLCLNPEAYRDPIILYVESETNMTLLDGLQTWSTVARVLDGALPLYMDEQVFKDAYSDLEFEEEPKKGLLYFANTDNTDDEVFYDFERESETYRWPVPKGKKLKARAIDNVEAWSQLFLAASSRPYQGCEFHMQSEDSQYVCTSIVTKIKLGVSVPVVKLKKQQGWTLETASAYVSDIMCNREPLCPHETCMILHTDAVNRIKKLASDPKTGSRLSPLIPDVRGSHFAVLLSAALMLKGSPGAPGSESSHQFLRSLTMDLELCDDDVEYLTTGVDLLRELPKFPRPTKERIALVVAYLAKHPETDARTVEEVVLRKSNKALKEEEGGTQFFESMKDNLANSFLAMERLMGTSDPDAARTTTFSARNGDMEVIDLT